VYTVYETKKPVRRVDMKSMTSTRLKRKITNILAIADCPKNGIGEVIDKWIEGIDAVFETE
jgi:hypothetical protein